MSPFPIIIDCQFRNRLIIIREVNDWLSIIIDDRPNTNYSQIQINFKHYETHQKFPQVLQFPQIGFYRIFGHPTFQGRSQFTEIMTIHMCLDFEIMRNILIKSQSIYIEEEKI